MPSVNRHPLAEEPIEQEIVQQETVRQVTAHPTKVSSRALVIAIDGPAGVGKTELSVLLANALGYLYLDTGAIYRAVTLAALEHRIPLDNASALGRLAEDLGLQVLPAPTSAQSAGSGELDRCTVARPYTVLIGGLDVTARLFTAEIDASVSRVAAQPRVREAVLPIQRRFARTKAVVAGRDIGTVVLPNADLKIYLDASAEVRARRRSAQLTARSQVADYAVVLAEIRRRDRADSEREVAPLRVASDAVVINTDELTIEAELALLIRLAEGRSVAS